MAIHNQIILYGFVSDPARIIKQDDGTYIQGGISVLTAPGKRTLSVSGRASRFVKLEYATIPVYTGNPDLIETMDELKKGDIVLIKGNLITRNITKTKKCDVCGTPYIKKGMLTFVNPIDLNIEKRGLSEAEGEMELKKHCEISNVATIIGTICSPPTVTSETKYDKIVKFPLAIDRKFFIKEDNPETRVDYPVVQLHGENGEDALKRCHPGTKVFIDGTIQFRKYKEQLHDCQNPECKNQIKWNDWTLDIVPYDLEYLSDWYTDEDLSKMALESIGIKTSEEVKVDEEG